MASTSEHRPRSWLELLTATLLVAGCAGPAPTASPALTATPPPTAIPTVTPTPTALSTPVAVISTPTPLSAETPTAVPAEQATPEPIPSPSSIDVAAAYIKVMANPALSIRLDVTGTLTIGKLEIPVSGAMSLNDHDSQRSIAIAVPG